jgi:hypothetical protein
LEGFKAIPKALFPVALVINVGAPVSMSMLYSKTEFPKAVAYKISLGVGAGGFDPPLEEVPLPELPPPHPVIMNATATLANIKVAVKNERIKSRILA